MNPFLPILFHPIECRLMNENYANSQTSWQRNNPISQHMWTNNDETLFLLRFRGHGHPEKLCVRTANHSLIDSELLRQSKGILISFFYEFFSIECSSELRAQNQAKLLACSRFFSPLNCIYNYSQARNRNTKKNKIRRQKPNSIEMAFYINKNTRLLHLIAPIMYAKTRKLFAYWLNWKLSLGRLFAQ